MKDKNRCRNRLDSFHVSYVVSEDMEDVETKNSTHLNLEEDDLKEGEYEYSWVVDWGTEPAERMTVQLINSNNDFDFRHKLKPNTIYQLADMFALAAAKMREMELEAEINRLELKQSVDQTKLF